MAKFQPPQIIPSPIPEDRFAQNNDLPSSSALRRGAWALNHMSMYQRKQVFNLAHDIQNTPAPTISSQYIHYFCFRTGENVESLKILMALAPASQASGAGKAAAFVNLQAAAPDIAITSSGMYYPEVAAGPYAPSAIAWSGGEIAVEPNKLYLGNIQQIHYTRIHSVMIHESAANVGVSSEDGLCNPLLWEANRPIYDAGIQDLLETGTKLWKHNGSQLISWSRHSVATTPTINTTSYVNIFGGAAAWSASAPGFQYGTLYHNTMNGDVPAELGVFAVRTAGTGTLNIKLVQNGSTVLTKTGIDSPMDPMDVSAHMILAHAPAKTDILASVSDGGTTWQIYAIGLWEYEA